MLYILFQITAQVDPSTGMYHYLVYNYLLFLIVQSFKETNSVVVSSVDSDLKVVGLRPSCCFLRQETLLHLVSLQVYK